jgi:ABC-2 type transport system ATP-binding protein
MRSALLCAGAELPKLKVGDDVRVNCDGCPGDITAKVYFIATTAEYAACDLQPQRTLETGLSDPGAAEQTRQPARRPAGQYLHQQQGRAVSTVAAQSDIAIEVHGLSKSFNGRQVVRDLSMQVKRGSIYGFLGPNGSGKTTTIRMLRSGDARQRRGTCLGYDIGETRTRSSVMWVMTQRFSLYQDLSVRGNLEFVARLYGVPDPRKAAREMISASDCQAAKSSLLENYPAAGSGCLRCARDRNCCCLTNRRLVDPKARRGSGTRPCARSRRSTVLVSTHYMDEAERCHEIAYIAYGNLLAHGTVEEVIAIGVDDLHGDRA